MILESLYRYYETLLNDPESGVSRPGFSKARVGWALVISKSGELLEIIDLKVSSGKKQVPRVMDVPEQVKRSSNVAANFLCDNCQYILGMMPKGKQLKAERVRQCFEASVELHTGILSGLDSDAARAVVAFFRRWNPQRAESHPVVEKFSEALREGDNMVFKLEGAEEYVHRRSEIMDAWNTHQGNNRSSVTGQCLVLGKEAAIARLHPSLKGVQGAQPSGATLVGFNLEAFESYGKKQSYNSPVSEEAAFGYTTALNHLLRSRRHHVQVGDTTVVFWAERGSGGREESLLQALFNPPREVAAGRQDSQDIDDNSRAAVDDPEVATLLQHVFDRVRAGKPVAQELDGINLESRFYVLGLAPNESRVAVRFWNVDSFGSYLEQIGRHYRDMAIAKEYENQPDFIPVRWILRETAPLRDENRVPPLLGGMLLRAILHGTAYPEALYSSMLVRIRANQSISYERASLIKAILVRRARLAKNHWEVNYTMGLNEDYRGQGYMLGRLFALLEKAQQDAAPGINTTIREKYFATASASPATVFPTLLRLAQHHIAKSDYGTLIDRRIQEVISSIDRFPAYLDMQQQGEFILGYYHQRRALYVKEERKESAE